MANLADSEKYVTIEMRVSIDPKDGNIYMSSKDEDLMAQTAGGFRLQVPRTSRQDQALRSMVSALKDRKKKEDQSNLTFGNVLQSFLRGGENITVGEIRDSGATLASENNDTQELITRTTHQKMKTFSGWHAHAVPLGVFIDTRGDIDSEASLHLVTASWNMQRDPHLYVRGPVASGKTTILNNMKKYFISKGVPFTAISLSDRESSLALLKKVVKATHSYGESIPNAPTSVLIIDDFDDVFAEKLARDFSDIEAKIWKIFKDLAISGFKGFNVVIAGNIGSGSFGIKTELILNQKNYTPPVVGDKIVQIFESRGQTYHQSNESLSPELRIATFVQRYPNVRREDVIMYARQIALYQFDE